MAVATELHFTRAAERLGIAQPPLSQQIQQLEQELGAQLFVRNRRGVALTEAGSAFLVEAQNVLEGADRAKEAARRAARGEIGALSLGFTVSAGIHPFVPRLIRTYCNNYPGVKIRLVERSTNELVKRVHDGSVDLAFVRAPCPEMPGVQVESILSESMLAVVPATHRLAHRQAISLGELSRDAFIFYPRKVGTGLYNAVVRACEVAGFRPAEGIEVPQLTSVVAFVAAGMGVSVVPATMSQLEAENVRYLRLRGQVPIASLAIAYCCKESSIALRHAIELIRQSVSTSPSG